MPAGRPTFKPTAEQRSQVKLFAAYGISHEDIAEQIGIDPKTLRKHFRKELKTGVTEANAKIAQRLFKKAIDGDTTAMIWWTKARAGWRETQRQEVTGADGGPVQLDVSKLTDDELQAILRSGPSTGRRRD